MRLTRKIASLFIKDHDNTDDPDVRARYGLLEGWVSIIVNFLLFGVKIVPGFILGSISLIADAFHSLTDSASSLIIIVGFKASRKPSDRHHPFGHERAENVTALIVAVMVIVTGVEFIRTSAARIMEPDGIDPGWPVILLIALTIPAKEVLALFSRNLGKIIKSTALEGDFWHHRSDALSTLLVVAALIASKFGFRLFDGIAGILVGLIIIYAGIRIGKDAVSPLLGEAPSSEYLNRIEELAGGFEEVEGVHDIIVHQYGSLNLVSLHIEVSDKLPPLDAHELAENVEDLIEKEMCANAVIHVDPVNRDFEHYGEIEKELNSIIEGDDRIHSFHDLRVVGKGDKVNLVFDLSVDTGLSTKHYGSVKYRISSKLKEEFPFVKSSVITVEPKYSYR